MSAIAELITTGHTTQVLPSASDIAAERLAPLAYARLDGSGQHADTKAALRPHVVCAAAADLAQTAALLEVGRIAADLPMLVIKGAANGPLLYGDGTLRPRQDIDVWLDGWGPARELADRLIAQGFRETHQLPGHVARHAIALRRTGAEQIDVHAACARRIRVARALPFDAAWRERRAFVVEQRSLWTLGARDGWLLGAMHLTAHHGGQRPPLVLIEDLRRLAAELGDDDWATLWEHARTHGLLGALRAAIAAMASWCPGALPPGFTAAAAAAADDASQLFEGALGAVLDDLDMLDADAALAYLGELLFPPADYLHTHYGIATTRPRALLACHRLLSSAGSMLR